MSWREFQSQSLLERSEHLAHKEAAGKKGKGEGKYWNSITSTRALSWGTHSENRRESLLLKVFEMRFGRALGIRAGFPIDFK